MKKTTSDNKIEYPDYLLPKVGYNTIDNGHEALYLVRHTLSTNFLNEEQNGIKDDEIPTSQMFDLSTYLLGTFTIDDVYIDILREGERSKYFIADWNYKDKVVVPEYEHDFVLNKERGFFFFKISDLEGLEVPCTKGAEPKLEHFKVNCHIIHTPNNSNFWHFSIRWLDDDGNDILNVKASYKNRLKNTARATISEFAIWSHIPEYSPITILNQS